MAGRGISRVNKDKCGPFLIVGVKAPTVFAEGFNVTCIGADTVVKTNLVEGSSNVLANGIPVCRLGDKDNLGQASSGSSTVFVN